jgi:hypothetical protein
MNQLLLSHWSALAANVQRKGSDSIINGSNLDLATVVAVARYIKILTTVVG